MSHIAPSDSEDRGDDQYSRESKPHGRHGHASSSSPFSQSRTIIDVENLSEASGGPTVRKGEDKDGLHHKKQVQGLRNFENNKPAATYGATAATATSTTMQTPTGSGRRTVISEHRNEHQPLIFSRPPMQRQNQNRFPGDQNGGDGAINVQDPPGDGDGRHAGDGGDAGGGNHPPGERGWKRKCSILCRHVRFASIFVVVLIFLVGVVSITVWLTVINKQNTKPHVTYANLFEVIPLEDMLHPLTKDGADVKINLTGRVDPNFDKANFHPSIYRGSCVSPPNQTRTTRGGADNYQIFGQDAFVSSHALMLGPSAELNISFTLSNSTLKGANIKVYFFKSYEDMMNCKTSEYGRKCLCYFFIPSGDRPSFSYDNGSYGHEVICDEKPFKGQHYFLTRFLGVNQDKSLSTIYDHLFVNFTFVYSTTGVFNPLATDFTGQECKSLDDTNDKIYEYSCKVDYGSFFTAGRSVCTYLTLTTSYIAPEIDSRFNLFPITIRERHRDDVMIFIACVVLLAILFILVAYCAPCRLVLKTVRSRYAHRAYQALT